MSTDPRVPCAKFAEQPYALGVTGSGAGAAQALNPRDPMPSGDERRYRRPGDQAARLLFLSTMSNIEPPLDTPKPEQYKNR